MPKNKRDKLENETEAIKWLAKAKEYWPLTTQAYLGIIYAEKGQSITNYEIAIEYFKKALREEDKEERHGHHANTLHTTKEWLSEVYTLMGDIYFNNRSSKTNKNKARECYHKSADGGNGYAMSMLGKMYYEGVGTEEKNYPKAAHWCLRAAEKGEIISQADIAIMYELGQGFIKNEEESYKWNLIAMINENCLSQSRRRKLRKSAKNLEEKLSYERIIEIRKSAKKHSPYESE